jgi:predicted nucleotidyltransferase
VDTKRVGGKTKKMRFKDYLKESIIDIPRRTFAPAVFDDADTKNPKIKPSVKKLIDEQIKEFEKEYPVIKTALIGSILTKRYRNDADLDINVLFDVPKEKQEEERVRLSQQYLSAKNPNNIQGKLIPGSKHPINYYFITDQKTYDDQNKKADAVFDIETNKFIKRPDDFVFDPDLYVKEFERKVQELDVVKGELKRDIIDYNELKELTTDDVLNLQEKIKDKLEEIEDSLEDIVRIGDTVDAERRAAFDKDMSPDEIRQYGVKNRLPKNVIYKMLEKYHYLKFYKKCKKILEDGIVTDKEVQDLEMHEAITLNDIKKGAQRFAKDMYDKVKRMATTSKRYEYVAKVLQDVIDRKKKERASQGLPLRHDIGYYAAAVADTFKDIDPKKLVKMVSEEVLTEGKSVAFTFGRFNPPTIGHEKLINKVKSQPTNDYKIYLSRSQDSKKNPLNPNQKLNVMKSMFPSHARNIQLNPTNMVLDLATDLYKKGYKDITMVVGSDRVREFETILKKYNDVKSRHGFYNFDNIKVVSAGERDPDAEGATGMSASKMRAAAAKGDVKTFSLGLPSSYKSKADELMKVVRKGMNLAASVNVHLGYENKPIASLEEFEQNQIRDLYVREMIFNLNDKIKYVKEDIDGIVKRRGTNYVVLEDNNNNLHKAWIWDCIPIAADREVEVREYNLDVDYGFKAVSSIEEDTDKTPQDKTVAKKPGTQPKKYYKDLSKGEKEKRADFFKRQKYKKSDDEDDYKPAPGDKDAKTKPSKHTLKYKKMFGELRKDLQDACWKGYKQVGMKDKNGKQVPNCVPEAYEIGADWANHTKEITPGQTPDAKPKPVGSQADNQKITVKDVEEWASAKETIDKYRERYGDNFKLKIDETKMKMLSFKDYVKI